jgi:hypothetical protein
MHGDEQLVAMWTNFLQHNRWIKRTSSEAWTLTDKGKAWINQIQNVFLIERRKD